MIASRIAAGDEAYLAAGEKLQLLAAQNSNYSLFDEKKNGSWGSKKTQRDEVTDVKNIGSEIVTRMEPQRRASSIIRCIQMVVMFMILAYRLIRSLREIGSSILRGLILMESKSRIS